MTKLVHSVAFGLVLLVLAAGEVSAVAQADKCEADKLKRGGLYSACRLKEESKAVKTGGSPDYSKCDAKLNQKWTDAETKAGGMCPTNGDEAAVHACLAAHADAIVAALTSGGTCGSGGLPRTGQTQCDQGAGTTGACPGSPAGQDGAVQAGLARSYTDNGDGTITDNVTGLMWEKLSDDGSIHDRDNGGTWYDAFNVKVAGLNAGGGFAGYADWRLPNVSELQSLLDYGKGGGNFPIDAAFNTGCAPGCTVLTCSCPTYGYTWTSTTVPASGYAFAVDFFIGSGVIPGFPKSTANLFRAVRGAL